MRASKPLLGRTAVAVVVALSLLAGGTAAKAGVRVTRPHAHIVAKVQPDVVQIGHQYVISGAVTPYVAGAWLYLERYYTGRWVTVGRVRSSPSFPHAYGTFRLRETAPRKPTDMVLRVVRGDTPNSPAGVSPTFHVSVVLLSYSATIPAHQRLHVSGSPYVMTGKVTPRTKGRVTLQRKVNGIWLSYATTVPAHGLSYRFSLTLTPGAYIFRVVVNATGRIAAGVGPVFHVIVSAPTPPTPAPAAPVVTTASLPAGLPGQPYAATLTGNGDAPLAWAGAGLPAGLSLSSSGVISGTPKTAGTSTVTVTVTDASGRVATAVLQLVIGQSVIRAWGLNSSGALGNGTIQNSTLPVPASALGDVTQVAAGNAHTLAVRADATVWAWGDNSHGQLGTGGASTSMPTQVGGLSSVTQVAAGSFTSYALRSDGVVLAWGRNSDGELGNGTITDAVTPIPVPGLTDVVAIVAGNRDGYALRRDGTVLSWGDNSQGQLGNSTAIRSVVPSPVNGIVSATAIAAGAADGYALLADGTVRAWGLNDHDQVINNVLGNVYNGVVVTPVAEPGLTNVTAITGGGGGSTGYALRSDGSEWAWGVNSSGQAGVGGDPNLDLAAPVQLPLAGVKGIGAGQVDGYAVLSDGTVRSWGDNTYGALGTGTSTNSATPVVVPGLVGAAATGGGDGWGWALVTGA